MALWRERLSHSSCCSLLKHSRLQSSGSSGIPRGCLRLQVFSFLKPFPRLCRSYSRDLAGSPGKPHHILHPELTWGEWR